MDLDSSTTVSAEYVKDLDATIANRARLTANKNLLFWYEQLYREQLQEFAAPERLSILEIGSGVSPFSRFYPNVITSDVLSLPYLDHVFDCHHIAQYEAIPDHSLDVITLTNVLHHLKDPIEFLAQAAVKLKPGGMLIATEPYFSLLSTVLNKLFHHEPVDFSIDKPELAEVLGPLSSANQALAWLIFRRQEWRNRVAQHFEFEHGKFRPFTAVSYFLTGGISRRFPVPYVFYRAFFAVDLFLSRLFPRLLASFFTIRLVRKS